MSYLIAAIDESMRPGHYLLCATVVSTADRANVRQSLRALLLPNQRRLHAKHEAYGRKRMLLKSIVSIRGLSCHIVLGRLRREGGREQCLFALVSHLAVLGVREFYLERVDDGTATRDVAILRGVASQVGEKLDWHHEAPHREPLLWVSDFVISAYGAGGEWRRESEPLITTVINLER